MKVTLHILKVICYPKAQVREQKHFKYQDPILYLNFRSLK